MNPMPVMIIWIGTAVFISCLTPDSDVKVEEPVKFIAINDDNPPISKNQEIISYGDLPREPAQAIMPEIIQPTINPLAANLLNGIQGSKAGVIAHPAK